jgi:hypothetical protein
MRTKRKIVLLTLLLQLLLPCVISLKRSSQNQRKLREAKLTKEEARTLKEQDFMPPDTRQLETQNQGDEANLILDASELTVSLAEETNVQRKDIDTANDLSVEKTSNDEVSEEGKAERISDTAQEIVPVGSEPEVLVTPTFVINGNDAVPTQKSGAINREAEASLGEANETEVSNIITPTDPTNETRVVTETDTELNSGIDTSSSTSKDESETAEDVDNVDTLKVGTQVAPPREVAVNNIDVPESGGTMSKRSSEEASKEEFTDVVLDAKIEKEGYSEGTSTPPAISELSFENLSFEAISLTSCQKIDFSVAYLTSLEFDGALVTKSKEKQDAKYWGDVYYFQMIIVPASIMLAFFGSYFLFPVSILTAAILGLFLVFHFVNNSFEGGLDCQVKLGLSVFSGGCTTYLAKKYVRFGLFCLGSVATGTGAYMLFDAFPALDPGISAAFVDTKEDISGDASMLRSMMSSSDISPLAWGITILTSLFVGMSIRVYEQISVEILTAVMGGVGMGYSMHSHILLHKGTIDRSITFAFAFVITCIGTYIVMCKAICLIAKLKKNDS